jgi:uncharacterized protein YdhG (YjbR/CyaY superfamily)
MMGDVILTNYSAKDVDEYISGAPKESRLHLSEIRAAIKSAIPKAEERISWGKPYYKYLGMLAGFDALKNHISFEIWTDELQSKDRKMLEEKGYKTGKRTFQISYDQKVPTAVIKKMLKKQAKINEVKSRKQ